MELCRPEGITVLRLPRIESMLNSRVCTLGLDLPKTDTSSDSSHRKRAHSDLSIVMCRGLRGGGAKHLHPRSAREESEGQLSSKGPYRTEQGADEPQHTAMPAELLLGSETPAQKLIPVSKEKGYNQGRRYRPQHSSTLGKEHLR